MFFTVGNIIKNYFQSLQSQDCNDHGKKNLTNLRLNLYEFRPKYEEKSLSVIGISQVLSPGANRF